MSIRRRSRIAAYVFLLILLLSLFSACLGSPDFKIIFHNDMQQIVEIRIDDVLVGTVEPGEEISYDRIPWDHGEYLIEATNKDGVKIFSKSLTREKMEETESRVYKVLIK